MITEQFSVSIYRRIGQEKSRFPGRGPQPCLDQISRQIHESTSLAVLDDGEVLYVARSARSRVMSVALNTGSRLSYCTSLGRVILAHLPPEELDAYLARAKLKPMTKNTIVSTKKLRAELAEVRQAPFAINDEELELGLRSIAVPMRGASGKVLAARISTAQLESDFLPVLLRGAHELSVLLP